MPEIIEVKISSDFVNSKSHLVFDRVEFSSVTKNPKDCIPTQSNFKINSTTRGKEMKLLIGDLPLIFHFGMSGNWKFNSFQSYTEAHSILESEKHHHFRLYSGGQVLSFWDPRRFGGWRTGDWSKDRGPDPIKEFSDFKANLTREARWMDKPIYEVLMDQKYFNGVGNYLRAEILDRCNLNPFQSWRKMSQTEREKLMLACQSIPLEVEQLGGGQLKDWDSPEGKDKLLFNQWLTCYGKKKSVVDRSNRNFWFDEKWLGFSKKKS